MRYLFALVGQSSVTSTSLVENTNKYKMNLHEACMFPCIFFIVYVQGSLCLPGRGESEDDFWWCIDCCANMEGWQANMV